MCVNKNVSWNGWQILKTAEDTWTMFIPFGVIGRIPAVYGPKQGDPQLSLTPKWAYGGSVPCSRVHQWCSECVLTPCYENASWFCLYLDLNQQPTTSQPSPPTACWHPIESIIVMYLCRNVIIDIYGVTKFIQPGNGTDSCGHVSDASIA